MPDVKISALPAATVPLAGTEVLPIVQSSTTRQVSVANLTAGRAISASSITNSALTSGRVTYAGTAGVLQDSANLTYNGTTLISSNGSGAASFIINSTANTPYITFSETSAGKFTIGESSIVGGGGVGFYDFYAGTSVGQRFFTGAAQRMVITSAGLVGIGTSSPNATLQVTSSSFPVLKVADNLGGGAVALGDSTVSNNYVGIWRGAANSISGGGFLNVQGNGIAFMSSDNVFGSASERMRLDSSGNLLMGTTSTTVNPGIVVYGSLNNAQIQIGHASGVASGEGYIGFQYNGSTIGSITQAGTTGVLYNVTSDQRLKTNVVVAPSGNIDDIKVRSFDWLADGSHQEYGMVAQELLEVASYAVYQPENSDEMMAVDYSKLVPMMIKEIQDLKQRITALENK